MRDDWAWRACFALCCALLVAPLWVTDWLPLVDVPQHAAQLAIAQRWSDPGFDYPRHFELNWLANSIVPYAVSYVLALAFPIAVALKVVLGVALLGIPLAAWRLVATLGGSRWWVFATFPIAYGHALSWGFVPFVFAAPLGLLLVDAAIRFREQPDRRRAWTLVVLVHLLFACHVLVLAYAGLASAAIIAMGAPTLRARLVGAASLASVLPLTAAWWIGTVALTPDSTPISAPLVLDYALARVPNLLSYMVGAEDISRSAVLHGLLVILLPFLLGARPARSAWRYAPLATAVIFHFGVPMNVLDTALVYPRFTLFVIPALLVAVEPRARERAVARAAPVAVAVVSLALVIARFHAFGVESRGVAALVRALEPDRRVLSLVGNPRSEAVPWFPYLHVGCWYQVERGGIADFSFAEFFPNRFRYRAGMDPPLPYNVEWAPGAFRWAEHGGALYDYFLVRGPLDPLLGDASVTVEVVARHGSWSVYRQRRP